MKIKKEIFDRISNGISFRNEKMGINLQVSNSPVQIGESFFNSDSYVVISMYNKLITVIEIKETALNDNLKNEALKSNIRLCEKLELEEIYIATPNNCYKSYKINIPLEEMTMDKMLDEIAFYALKNKNIDFNERTIATNKIRDKKISLERELNSIQNEISNEKEKDKTHQDKDKIEKLEKNKLSICLMMHAIEKDLDKYNIDKEVEKEWETRIKEALNYLKDATKLFDKEKTKSSFEWYVWIFVIAFLSLALIIWYVWFVSVTKSLGICLKDLSYIIIMPYLLPIPIYIAILWIGIIQKGKARKVQLSITNLLFNVHYLEGLLQMINKLSTNSKVAVENINNLLNDISKQYIQQIGKKDLDPKLMDNIEKSEDKDNPIVEKLIDILKNISERL